MIRIETLRFVLRSLTQQDATRRYLDWLHDPDANRFIESARQPPTMQQLKEYIAEREIREDVIFLAIMDRSSELHVGNIKFEPIDLNRGYAVVGILIGDASFRGRGVAAECLLACGAWLASNVGVRQLVLGVHRENGAAIRAYEKVGFQIRATPYIHNQGIEGVTMTWDLQKCGEVAASAQR
jgi:RimJ/RimL family protein N-acetyltransferase